MKKVFLLLSVVLTVVCCSPLRVAMDQTGSDGARYLLTSDQHLFRSGKGNVDIAIGAKIMGRDTILAFLLTCDANVGHGIFNKGNRLMFRLSDDSEIFLDNLYDKEYEEHEETSVSNRFKTDYGLAYAYNPWYDEVYVTPYEVTRVVPQVNTYKTTNSYALYLVTKPQMTDLLNKGIKKIRVEIEDSDLDMNDTDGVSGMFLEMCNCLKTAAADKQVRTEF